MRRRFDDAVAALEYMLITEDVELGSIWHAPGGRFHSMEKTLAAIDAEMKKPTRRRSSSSAALGL